MKKALLLLMFTSLAAANLYPQEKVALTNSTILKMVKAKLSEELIIDEIKNSTTRFNISPDSILFLVNNKVSDAVIREMKNVTGNQQPVSETTIIISSNPVAVKPPETVPAETKPPEVPEKKKTEEVKVFPLLEGEVTLSADALGYVVPLQSLMKFYEDEFKTLKDLIKGWDSKIRISVDEGNRIREKISNLEKEVYSKINSDSKGFTEEINSLKNKLSELRESYGTFQNSMVSDGLKMIREIEDFGSKLDRSITEKYTQAGQNVKKTDPDPSSVGGAKSIIITRSSINVDVVDYIAPMSVILFFYQNETSSLDKTIDLWNEKVAALTLKDKEVIGKLDPLKKELADLQTDQKKNKKPIAELKDRISDLEKQRKALEQQMSDDSADLSKYLAESCKAVQSSLKERIADIIEEIKYSYQDSFTYKSL